MKPFTLRDTLALVSIILMLSYLILAVVAITIKNI
jgi:hypothetical protein